MIVQHQKIRHLYYTHDAVWAFTDAGWTRIDGHVLIDLPQKTESLPYLTSVTEWRLPDQRDRCE